MKKVMIFALAMLVCTSCAAKKKVVQEQPQPVQQPIVAQQKIDRHQADLDSLRHAIELAKLKHTLDSMNAANGRADDAIAAAGIEVDIPCIESSFDDETYFRDFGFGTADGNNFQNCRNAAVKAAKGMIRERLGEFVQGVSTYYASSYSGSKDKNAVESKIANKLNGVVEKMLNDADKECEKRIRNPRGEWESYYVVRIPKYELKKNMIEAMSKEEKDGIDFHEYQMQKFMDERMNDMLEAKKNAGY